MSVPPERCRRRETIRSRETTLPSKRELTLATAFFALLALLTVAFLRPFGPTEWSALLASLAFVAAGTFVLWRGDRPAWRGNGAAAQSFEPQIVDRPTQRTFEIEQPDPIEFDADSGEPPPEERQVLETTLAALAAAGALAVGEVDASLMWRAAQHFDPGEPVGLYAALHSLVALEELGRFTPRRLVFVPSHTEYDAALLASITASALAALGHDVVSDDVTVALPIDGSQGQGTVAFTLDGRRETVAFNFLWKYPPSELLAALPRFARADDPRDLVCADIDYGTLLLAAIRPGSLDELNRCFPVGYDMFGLP